MDLPQEERAVLFDSLSNLHHGLYFLYQRLNNTLESFEPVHDSIQKAGMDHINEELYKALKSFEVIGDNIKDLSEYAAKA